MEQTELEKLLQVLPPEVVDYTLQKLHEVFDRDLAQILEARRGRHPNPLARYGRKCFSQSDEDGITLEIIRRLGLTKGGFAEFGVGNGLENNTLILLALGWRGVWCGGERLAIDCTNAERLHYLQRWITLDGIVPLLAEGCKRVSAAMDDLDLVSLDLDGNDLYLVRALLEAGCLPKVFIVEYNGKFPPPVRFTIAYDPEHQWGGDDYYGASLMSFVDLFTAFGYRLVCCNTGTGSNAYFVREEYSAAFDDVPSDIADIYAPPHFHLIAKYGHPVSPRTVERVIHGA